MNRRVKSLKDWTIVLLTFIVLFCNTVLAKYSGGSGEPNDPYQIANVADLLTLADDANDYNKCFVMIADINLDPNLPGGQVFTTAVIAPDTNSVLSGFQGTKFTGVFDGSSHTISNLTITASTRDYVGLLGYVGENGQIRNLGVESVFIIGNLYVGGLVGLNSNNGSLTSCYVSGTVSSDANYVGGLVGRNSGSLTSCYVSGSATGNLFVGGMVGHNSGTLIMGEIYGAMLTSCYATVSVSGTSAVGGLVGDNVYGTLTSCYSNGSVSGTRMLGGLVGDNWDGAISSCYSTDSVNGTGDRIGGLVGHNYGIILLTSSYSTIWTNEKGYVSRLVGNNHPGRLTDCYSTGPVSGNIEVGGLLGHNYYASVISSYSIGSVSGNSKVGGLVGSHSGSITSCFWDIDTSGTTVGVGYIYGFNPPTDVTGKTTVQMRTRSTFINAGWDFNDVWHICETTNYPKLLWQILTGDIVCPDVVDTFDLAELCNQWLFDEIPADFAPPPSGDGIVDFADFSIFASQWGITNDIDELLDFTEQWLKTGVPFCSADISPLPEGDSRVNAEDFALMAENWLQ